MERRRFLKSTAWLLAGVSSAAVVRAIETGVPAVQPIGHAFLDSGQRAMIETLAGMIIPRTDTPGAIEAGVPHFIELMVSDWYTATERGIFVAGLAQLDEHCVTHAGKPFTQCDTAQQVAALGDAERLAGLYVPEQTEPDIFGRYVDQHTPFFTKLKELTVLGYYTSEVGATQELAYNPMPMRYDGDHDFAAIGRQWSW
jgi:hypothetical protein